MPVFHHPYYKSMETLSCHSSQTEELIFAKSVKADMMNISIKSQTHRAYGVLGGIFFYFGFHCNQ